MGILRLAAGVAVLVGNALCQLEGVKYCEASTGICYSSYTNEAGISYRIALPVKSATSDAIVQIEAPIEYKWAGLAWGGHMALNPLTVTWPNEEGRTAIVSSRMAFSYWVPPNPYEDATYTYLKGTKANATHWTVTARCQGCTRWDIGDGPVEVDAGDDTVFAFAYSTLAPDEPASNTSFFNVHDSFGHWAHNLKLAKSPLYNFWVKKNSLPSE